MSEIIYLGGPEVQAPQVNYPGLKRRRVNAKPKCEPATLGLTRGILADALRRIKGAVGLKASMPILSYVNLKVETERMTVRATDLQTYAEISLPRDGMHRKKPLEYCIPWGALSRLCKGPKNDRVQFGINEVGRASVTVGPSSVSLVSLPADEFPAMPNVGGSLIFVADAAGIVDMMKKGVVCTSDDETMMALTALSLVNYKTGLNVVSTDSHRLTIYGDHGWGVDIKRYWKEQILIPRGSAKAIAKAMKGYEIRVGVSKGQTHAEFEADNLKIVVRLIEGKFPDYMAVIPKKTRNTLSVKAADMLRALEHVMITAQDRAASIKLHVDEGKQCPRLMASTADIGESSCEFAGQFKGPLKNVAYNGNYLKALLKSYSGAVTFQMTDDTGPTLVTSTVDEEPTTVIMPMRL